MQDTEVLAAEGRFFAALIARDTGALDELLTQDFLLVDVMAGSEITKAALLAVMEAGQLRFEAIEPAEQRVRFYETTAIVNGRTQMRGLFGETPFATKSRYTHVYVAQHGRWRLAAAQGTQITGE